MSAPELPLTTSFPWPDVIVSSPPADSKLSANTVPLALILPEAVILVTLVIDPPNAASPSPLFTAFFKLASTIANWDSILPSLSVK